MQPVIVQPDIELWATTFLRTQLPLYGFTGVRVSNSYTGTAKEVTVRRDGGPRLDVVREAARLGVNVYSTSDTDVIVSDLSRIVAALLCASADGNPVINARQLSGPSPIPDPAARRRFMTFELWTRGTKRGARLMAYHLIHPDSGQEIEVDSDRVPMYLTQGWKTKPSVKDPEVPAELVGALATIKESE